MTTDVPTQVPLSAGLGRSDRPHSRALRIRELQAELRALLDEEAAEACKDLAATKVECARIAKAGQRVEAVKLYRNKTGLSLRESMQMVDSLISAA